MTYFEKVNAIVSNPELSKLNLTDKETDVLVAFIAGLYAEPGFSDVDVDSLYSDMNYEMSKASIKGVIGSLVKKGIVVPGDDFDKHFHGIIYLDSKYYYLHPTWSKEV